jgi:S-methylmethionine-dependent homocysteine/selenocysteine methylase
VEFASVNWYQTHSILRAGSNVDIHCLKSIKATATTFKLLTSICFFFNYKYFFFGLVNCKYINRLKPMHKHYNKESKKVTLLIWTNRKGQLGSQTRKPRTTAETKARHYKTKHMLSKKNHKYKSFNIATL